MGSGYFYSIEFHKGTKNNSREQIIFQFSIFRDKMWPEMTFGDRNCIEGFFFQLVVRANFSPVGDNSNSLVESSFQQLLWG